MNHGYAVTDPRQRILSSPDRAPFTQKDVGCIRVLAQIAVMVQKEEQNMRAYRVSGGCLLITAVTLVVVAAFRVQAKQTRADDEQQIRLLLASHATASQHGDLQGLVNVYHNDADVRYSDGTILHGRAEVEKRYRQALSNDSQAVNHSHPSETIHVHFLRPDVAFVDVDSVSSRDDTGQGEPVTRTPLFAVFTKEVGHWGVAVQRSGVPLK